MSNVLIGIVGVILFIGLALAGVLFLGSQFTNAGGKSDATAIMAQLQQMTQAVEMYRLRTGRQTINCQTVDFLIPRFLKTMPISPTIKARQTATSYMYKPQLNNDLVTDATPEQAAGIPAIYITTNIGNDQRAKEACRSISETYTKGIPTVDLTPPEKSGCGFFQNEYVAWIRI
jgi:hypothetical protein